MDLRGKKVVVVGLARSGVGAANLLAERGAVVTVTDAKPPEALKEAASRLAPSVKTVLGGHPPELFRSADLLVLSPGVRLDAGPIATAKAAGVPVIGELELSYRILMERQNSKMFLAITGSNGKSTTTTLLDLMLREGGFKTLLGGNIGNAISEEIATAGDSEKIDYVVAEVSSFQLESIVSFRPFIASILNITPDHMDRYHALSEYASAKARIFENQADGDFLVLNADDELTVATAGRPLSSRKSGPRVIWFSRKKEVEGVYWKDGKVYCSMELSTGSRCPSVLIDSVEIAVKGVHNLENAMAASAMALLAGCPPGAVAKTLREFGGLEHRLEFVRELGGVRYFNDSKGTNVGAVVKSLESFEEPLILIAGGRDKAGDFSALRDLVSTKVKTLVLIGEAAGKISESLDGLTEIITAKDMREAVMTARKKAKRGDIILLSPACASFDMFQDFEDRGRAFKKVVRELNNASG